MKPTARPLVFREGILWRLQLRQQQPGPSNREQIPRPKAGDCVFRSLGPGRRLLEPGKTGGIWNPFAVGGMFVLVGLLGIFGKQKPA